MKGLRPLSLHGLHGLVEAVEVHRWHAIQQAERLAPALGHGHGAEARIPSDLVGAQLPARHRMEQMQGLCPAFPKAIGLQSCRAQLLIGPGGLENLHRITPESALHKAFHGPTLVLRALMDSSTAEELETAAFGGTPDASHRVRATVPGLLTPCPATDAAHVGHQHRA